MKTKKRKPTQAQLRRAFEKASKLSQVLAIGLHDLRAAELNKKKYKIYMHNWCVKESDKCTVCLAGSVMAGRYPKIVETAYTYDLTPYHGAWDGIDDAKGKFRALNFLRGGEIGHASEVMAGVPYIGDMYREVCEYDAEDPKPWWDDMRKLLKDLRAAGL